MDKLIFDKTNKGREEIATRKYGLAPRMRSLLVLVDGKKSRTELLKKVAGLGLTDQSIIELIDNEFIENIFDTPTVAPTVAPAVAIPAPTPVAAAPVPAVEVVAAIDESVEENSPALPIATPLKSVAEEVQVIEIKAIGAEQLQALHKFFNETIKSTIGLRGFSLQLKAEQAAIMNDFYDLRQPYLDAVLKAKGQEITISLRDRLDQLLIDAEKSTQ